MKEVLDIQFYYKALYNFIDIDMPSTLQQQNTGHVVTRSSLEPHKLSPPISALKQLQTFTSIELFISGMTFPTNCDA